MKNELEEEEEIIKCTHDAHEWLIDSPNGPTSKGKCLNCGTVSEFKNSMPVSGWDRTDNSKSKKSKKNDIELKKSKKSDTELKKS